MLASRAARARTNGSGNRRVLAFARRIRMSPYRRILAASSNGEVERPRRSAGLAPRAHNLFQRPRCPTTCASRPVPTLVRGRPHQPTVRARNLQRKPKLTDATNPDRPAEAQPRQSAATGAGFAWWPLRLPARAQAEAFSEGSWPLRVESDLAFQEDSCCVL